VRLPDDADDRLPYRDPKDHFVARARGSTLPASSDVRSLRLATSVRSRLTRDE